MSRSIGDHASRSIGIIWTPELYLHKIMNKFTVLVVGSDGIFGVINNKDIADIVWMNRIKTADEVSQIIVKEAALRWKEKDSDVDDWTCVVVYLEP